MLLRTGLERSNRAPDERYNYGYKRELFVWSLISGVGIFCLGAGVSIVHGIHNMMHPVALEHIWRASRCAARRRPACVSLRATCRADSNGRLDAQGVADGAGRVVCDRVLLAGRRLPRTVRRRGCERHDRCRVRARWHGPHQARRPPPHCAAPAAGAPALHV